MREEAFGAEAPREPTMRETAVAAVRGLGLTPVDARGKEIASDEPRDYYGYLNDDQRASQRTKRDSDEPHTVVIPWRYHVAGCPSGIDGDTRDCFRRGCAQVVPQAILEAVLAEVARLRGNEILVQISEGREFAELIHGAALLIDEAKRLRT